MKRKTASVASLIASLVLALSGCGQKASDSGDTAEQQSPGDSGQYTSDSSEQQPLPPSEEPLVIRIGADSYNFSYQFRVAEAVGIFDKYNIDATISTFSFGIDTINAAILGETDSAEGMDYAVASRFSESNNLRIVAHICGPNSDGEKLYVRDPSVNSVTDLAGKKLGVKKGTVNEFIWGKVFENYNIDPESVEQVYLGSSAELLAAYQTDNIAAFWGTPDIEEAILAVPGTKILGDYDLSKAVPRGYLLLDNDFIQANKAGVTRLLKALDEATDYIRDNPEETARIAYEDLKVPEDAALEGIRKYTYDVRLSQEDLDHITNVANWSIEHGLIKNKYDITQFLYLDALREALPDKISV
ncbi:MAG: ABC transporter substrate-binding protein [Clostridiales bacterium]|jgi:NitT/TauT family transport system substrate-binding protein|nr:ABC transporter substrate-binding protein [Clostridiales bacterium]